MNDITAIVAAIIKAADHIMGNDLASPAAYMQSAQDWIQECRKAAGETQES